MKKLIKTVLCIAALVLGLIIILNVATHLTCGMLFAKWFFSTDVSPALEPIGPELEDKFYEYSIMFVDSFFNDKNLEFVNNSVLNPPISEQTAIVNDIQNKFTLNEITLPTEENRRFRRSISSDTDYVRIKGDLECNLLYKERAAKGYGIIEWVTDDNDNLKVYGFEFTIENPYHGEDQYGYTSRPIKWVYRMAHE